MSEIVLETEGLTKYYGSSLAVDHLDLEIPRGCICGFVGRNGAGKTTAIKLMLGLLQPTAGSSRLLGCDSSELTPAIRQRIGYVTEGHRLFRWMSIAGLEKFQRAFFPKQWDDKFFADMIEYFDLPKKKKIKHLSNGQRAQVSLALALAPNPELLIMDDPTLGLDAAIRRQFLEGMIGLIMREGRTVLFSSHILGDVERVSERIVVIDKGVLRAYCSLEQFQEAVTKVIFTFTDSAPDEVNIEGLLHCKRTEKQLELTLVGIDDEQITEWAKSAGAENYDIMKMNLEDQFIEFTAPANQKKLFKWEER
ncbi:MAG: ABC transporter ATP-binding protein [Planctomycetes bacterium]|nr:ABC transporter ATP-binding protein [Planctomycetota bacterium]